MPCTSSLEFHSSLGNGSRTIPSIQKENPLTKATFTQHFRATIQATGHPESQFAGHSFRIGTAATTASAGIEDSIITCLVGETAKLFCSKSVPPDNNWQVFQNP